MEKKRVGFLVGFIACF